MQTSRVLILAGGKGVRLRPFTASFPKPLVPLGDKPILAVILEQLMNQGFQRVTLALGHLSGLVSAYVECQKHLVRGMDIDYTIDERETGTAGSLASVAGLDSTFMVMNGDVLTNIDYNKLISAHRRSRAALTIAAHAQEEKIDLGVLRADEHGTLIGYSEKPVQKYEVSMGIYVYEPSVLRFIQPNAYLDLPTLVNRLLDEGEKVHIHRNDAFWLDIGRPDDYARAQELYQDSPEFFGIKRTVEPPVLQPKATLRPPGMGLNGHLK